MCSLKYQIKGNRKEILNIDLVVETSQRFEEAVYDLGSSRLTLGTGQSLKCIRVSTE